MSDRLDSMYGAAFDALTKPLTDAHGRPYTPEAPVRRQEGPLAPLDIDGLLTLVGQAQTVQKAVHGPGSPVPVWARGDVAKTAAWSVIVPTLVTGCANLSAHQWGSLYPAVTGGLISAASLALAVSGLDKHWDMQGAKLAFAVSMGSLSFTLSAGAGGWTEVVSWLTSAGTVLGYKILWNRRHAESRAKVALTEAKARTERIKGDAALTKSAISDALKLVHLEQAQRAATYVEQGPNLGGDTAEEMALRKAFHEAFGEELLTVTVADTLTGWTSVVGLKEMARKDALNGWDKVQSRLRAAGRFVVTEGRLTNELSVKFVDPERFSTSPLTWSSGVIPADHKHSMSLGVNTETGEPVLLQFDERLSICGASGTGKSWAARPLLAHAHLHGDLVLIDGKGEEGNVWADVCRVANEPDEIIDVIEAVHQEMQHRKGVLKEQGRSVWAGEQLTVFVDEGQVVLAVLAALESKEKARMQQMLRELSSLGRSRGVVLWWATQKPVMSGSAPGIDNLISPNMLQRISLRVADSTEAGTALDDCAHYGPHLIPDDRKFRGHGYVKGRGPSLIRSWTMDDDAIRALPVSVWRGESEATPAERVKKYLSANPGASQRDVASATGVSLGSVNKLVKTL